MSIVAMSDTLGSLGDEFGRELGRTLGYDFSDREIIAKAAERFGEGVMELAHVTEEKPTLWERFTDTRRHYLTYVEATLLEMAARDNVILSGRGAFILLGKIRHVLRVRISAPERLRAQRVERQQGLTPDAAFDAVRQTDRERAARVRFLYHADWDDPLLYDLSLNTERITVDRAVRLVQDTLQAERFQPTTESRAELVDLSLVAQTRAALMKNPVTRALDLHAACKDGYVSVSGMVADEEQQTLVRELVGPIPGVRGVLNEVVVAPSRSYAPRI
jgi:cytidylate kinase